jgi:chorismate mutase
MHRYCNIRIIQLQEKNMDILDSLRKKIDTTDIKISTLLKKRFELVKDIGKLKAKNGLPIHHKKREELLLSGLKTNCKGSKECQDYLSNIFKNIYKESRKAQKKKDHSLQRGKKLVK